MNKIQKKIKSKKDFDKMMAILSERVNINNPISDNGMLDGLIIGFIFSTGMFALDLFLKKNTGRVLDGTLQKLEYIVIWVTNNEDAILKILKDNNF